MYSAGHIFVIFVSVLSHKKESHIIRHFYGNGTISHGR